MEAWAPEYGTPIAGDEELTPSDAKIDHDVEVPLAQWGPRWPASAAAAPSCIVFTDGVRRVEAQVWVADGTEGGTGGARPGICASYAAGAVRCDGRAEVVATEVRRGLFTAASDAAAIETRHGQFPVRAAAGDTGEQLSLCLQQRMTELELEVAKQAGEAELICVDGPLRAGGQPPGTVGYVKTHHVRYLLPQADAVIGQLEAGQRTPVFLATARMWTRYSWYVRLPGGGGGHPWAGIVRCETGADAETADVVRLADAVTVALPRFASEAQKDPRAPQNLYPIAGLERRLRHRLGDPALLYRALRRAAADSAASGAPGSLAAG